ncbi:probable endonuclease 4 isoform X1 [Paramuricea clavata]|uniref:Probable endonuclease 4 isoform X1 n=1 Tax=Paramuricea clavata TaxID=317549 RepID=A0A7D9LTT7_PARCT|nr:probable endonuclease 4 isoform X1 [Paramuricea clavata]
MSRRSTRLAKKAEKSVFEDNEIASEPTQPRHSPTKKTRPNHNKKTKALTYEKFPQDEKHLPENFIQIKEEKNVLSVDNEHFTSTSSHAKTKDQTSGDKITQEDKYVGAHVSISGGLHLAAERALEIGAKSFAMFLRSQRQWNAKPLDPKNADLFRSACKEFGFSPHVILPHGIYLMNCGSPEAETLSKSRQVLVDELKRCEMLGLTLYNFHPGSSCGKISVDECLDLIAESINLAHQQTKYVVTVLENMSCQGNTVRTFIVFLDLD